MILKIKVIPKSRRTEFAGVMADGTIKVRVAAAPERGKANAELIAFLAKAHGVSRDAVAIVSGETSQLKHVRIEK